MCSDICPRRLSFPRSEQFSESVARGKLWALTSRNNDIPMTSRNNAKLEQTRITFNIQVKSALCSLADFRQSTKSDFHLNIEYWGETKLACNVALCNKNCKIRKCMPSCIEDSKKKREKGKDCHEHCLE